MAARTKISASLVSQFVNVTGASKDIARSLLEACNGNLEMAIEMHLDSCEAPASEATSSYSNSATGSGLTAGSTSNSNQYVVDFNVYIRYYYCLFITRNKSHLISEETNNRKRRSETNTGKVAV